LKEDQQPPPAGPADASPALQQTISNLTPICQDNPVAMCITDRQARVLYANQAFADFLETRVETDAIKRHALHNLFSQRSRRVTDYMTTLIDEGRSLSLNKILHLGAEHTPTPMQIRVQMLPAADGQPSEGAMLSFQEDVNWYRAQFAEDKQVLTARIRQLSTDLMDRQSLLKAMMDQSPFGIALFDNQRRIIQLNRSAEKMLDISRNEARGILCNNLFKCFEQGQFCPILEADENIDQQETCCAQPQKSRNTFLRSAVRSRERNEDIIIEAFIDITEMKGAQQAQKDAYRAKDDFFAKMSHELRTPLNAIIGYSELLSDDSYPLEPEELKEFAGAIQHGGYDLLHLVDQVLEINRIDESKVRSDPLDLRPEVIIEEVNSTIRPLAGKNNNQYLVQCDSEVGTVYADREHLRAILLNLLSNACKFTQLGTVAFTVKREIDTSGEWVVFEISDTGIGMNEEQIQRIFNRFEQADNSATRGFGGSGLGLCIAKDLTEIMGGRIEVKSEPGKGSTFTVRLPGKAPAQSM
jgi:PAS domain S-box-containing protein